MRSWARRGLCGTVVALAVGTGVAPAQTSFPEVKVTGRLQEQAYYFDNADFAAAVGPESNLFTRRARVEARVRIAENVSVFIQPSFEGGRTGTSTTTCSPITVPDGGGSVTPVCRTTTRSGIRLRDAYVDVRFARGETPTAIYLRAGQEKRPFGRYELTSSVNLPSIERGAGAGLPGRASNNLFEGNGFLSHDVGASLRLERKLDDVRMLTLKAGVYNGMGESLNDVNDAKSYGVRGTFGITSKLDVGASWFAHDGIVAAGTTTDSSFTNYAWGVDASWGKPGDEGLYVVGDYMDGNDATIAKAGIRGLSLVGAYNIRLTSPTAWLYAIEPAFRYDIADPNTDADADRVTTITAILGVYVSSRTQFRVGYERQSFQADIPSVDGLRSALTVSF